jgi:uncharacterized protein with ATP-grasp and redox domains
MRAYPQCIPCLINQGLNAVKKLRLGEEAEREVALRALKYLSSLRSIDRSPAYYAYQIQKIVREVTGEEDPFRSQKRLANELALDTLPYLEDLLKRSGDPLAFALKVSAVGNYIDFAIRDRVNVREDVRRLLKEEFLVWDYGPLRRKLGNARTVLIIGDNAGEIAFDKILVKVLREMSLEVVYAVKGGPILNDATLEDAEEVSMTSLCRVIDNGSDKVGTWLEDCSETFREVFLSSDVVISKGQANFETLSSAGRDLFFLLVAKCEPIAEETGGLKGKLILKYQGADIISL